jgi:hypothetical protein
MSGARLQLKKSSSPDAWQDVECGELMVCLGSHPRAIPSINDIDALNIWACLARQQDAALRPKELGKAMGQGEGWRLRIVTSPTMSPPCVTS